MTAKNKDETVSKLDKITAQSTTIEVMGQEFEIKPLTNKEFLQHVTGQERQSGESQTDTVIELVTTVLQKDDPNVTKEKVEDAPPALIAKTMQALEEVNGLEDFIEMSGKTTSR